MPQTLIPITYQDPTGRTQQTAIVRGKPMRRREENFCRLIATGEHDPIDAYCQVYEKEFTPLNGAQLARSTNDLMGRTDIQLRIQQLRSPVLPKIAEKYEYSLNKALEQCQVAWDVAFVQGDTRAMVKVIEMQSRLAKLLSQELDVNVRLGFLDNTATEVLLQMKQQLEEVRAARKQKTIDITPKETPPCGS